jgi:hypothetical protein
LRRLENFTGFAKLSDVEAIKNNTCMYGSI